jgi:hypothetical protein
MKTYTSKEVQKMTNLSSSGLQYRAGKLEMPVRIRFVEKYKRERYFNEEEVFKLKNFNNSSDIIIPQVIYVNYHIYESKINYLEI